LSGFGNGADAHQIVDYAQRLFNGPRNGGFDLNQLF